jgi:hypothetical protein
MSRVGKHLVPLILGVGLLLASCHPSGAQYVTDLDTVTTTHDPNFNFAGASTYSLPDRVVFISDSNPGGNPDRLPPDLEQLILATINNEMTALGYTQVDITQNPDLTLTVGALKITNVSVYYGYWCGYWGWYYPCYPYYPPVVGVSSYAVGSLLIDMAPNVPTSGGQYQGVWTAVIRGIQTGNSSTDRTRLVNGISQAFIQSPYLGKP